ncbi:MAG: cytochrome c oxidase subunit II [Thiobacillus sp.]|nr:cytochrome c oxidase subunit II [Thiobacillus sp.]
MAMAIRHAPVAAAWLLILSGTVRADYPLNLPAPHSSVARTAYDLHILVLWICLAIFLAVFGVMFYALYKYRRSLGHAARPFHESALVETIWTVIPVLILVGIAWPATRAVFDQKDTGNPDLTIKITGHQWRWEYDYLQDGVRFISTLATPRDQIDNLAAKGEHYLLEVDQPLVVPLGKKVRVLLTSQDVIHSWWVPALGVKQDAIPGFIRDTWFRADAVGTYRGQCAELCGKDHAYMPIVVEVKSVADYEAGLAGRKGEAAAAGAAAGKAYSAEELKARGEKVFTAICAACHQGNGQGIPGTFPALAGAKVVNGPAQAHITTVLDGRPGTAMVAFKDQLDDLDIAAVISYERQAWGNAGGPVQPAQVKALRH